MSLITLQNRNKSFSEINGRSTAATRRKMVLVHLAKYPFGMGAKELAVSMFQEQLITSDDRNQVHPRLNELVKYGLVTVTGKRICPFTHKQVSVYCVVKDSYTNANLEEKEQLLKEVA